MAYTVTIPYEDYNKLAKDSADKENTVKLLNTEFSDDANKLIAIKSLLGVVDKPVEVPDVTEEPDEEGENNEP